jgi:hypothetical protein
MSMRSQLTNATRPNGLSVAAVLAIAVGTTVCGYSPLHALLAGVAPVAAYHLLGQRDFLSILPAVVFGVTVTALGLSLGTILLLCLAYALFTPRSWR